MVLHPERVRDTWERVSEDGTTTLPGVVQTAPHTHTGRGTDILTFVEAYTWLTIGGIYVLAGGKR